MVLGKQESSEQAICSHLAPAYVKLDINSKRVLLIQVCVNITRYLDYER